jgi:hypothetical protein
VFLSPPELKLLNHYNLLWVSYDKPTLFLAVRFVYIACLFIPPFDGTDRLPLTPLNLQSEQQNFAEKSNKCLTWCLNIGNVLPTFDGIICWNISDGLNDIPVDHPLLCSATLPVTDLVERFTG